MAVFLVYVRTHDEWAEIARFEASGTADALNKAKHVIPQAYGNRPIKLMEQPGASSSARTNPANDPLSDDL